MGEGFGEVAGVHADLPDVRLIPTHTGKTTRVSLRAANRAVHPRSRGESEFLHRLNGQDMGSSPLTQGKLEVRLLGGGGLGLIPTHAEKTAPLPGQHGKKRAHPRSRGENESTAAAKGISQGSSPVSWGKPRIQSTISFDTRLIPAHAGKTPSSSLPGVKPRAHPRSRGENAARSAATPMRSGSSPLTRGKRDLALGHCITERLIPAHTGKTW